MNHCPACGRIARKLNPAKAIEIRTRAAAGEKHEAIALDMGVTRTTVGLIASGKLWRHVAGMRSQKPKPAKGVTPPQFKQGA
jgi:DNA invertase Pin-like site-specific DNA recombinase